MSVFRKAERRRARLRLAISGISGAGKTVSSLLMAYGITGDWSKIAMVDTEGGRGELYVGSNIGGTRQADGTIVGGVTIGQYGYIRLTPPFEPEKYMTALDVAGKEGFEICILDSLSHAWAGEGGLLEAVDALKSRYTNQWAAWREITPRHNALVDAILQSPIHVICTLRAKTEWVVEEESGKKKPIKVGLQPVMRDGIEYEFTVVFDQQQDHTVLASKDNTSLFDRRVFVPAVETGRLLLQWLNQGIDEGPAGILNVPSTTKPSLPAAAPPTGQSQGPPQGRPAQQPPAGGTRLGAGAEKAVQEVRAGIDLANYKLRTETNATDAELSSFVQEAIGKARPGSLGEAKKLLEHLQKTLEARKAAIEAAKQQPPATETPAPEESPKEPGDDEIPWNPEDEPPPDDEPPPEGGAPGEPDPEPAEDPPAAAGTEAPQDGKLFRADEMTERLDRARQAQRRAANRARGSRGRRQSTAKS